MLNDLTELKIYIKPKETLLDKYINSLLAGDIKNLTIKEEYIMLEKLKEQREVYVAELENLRNTNLETEKIARFELAKPKIAEEVEREHNQKIADVETKIKHYNFVIEELEANAVEEVTTENVENIDYVEE